MSNNLGTLIVLSGPSGVGKSSMIKRLREAEPELEFSVSCTTRAPRNGENNHVDYHFLSEDAFAERLRAGDFIEYAEVHGHHYGTLKSEVWAHLEQGRDVLLDIDVQGARLIRAAAAHDSELRDTAEFVFIGPPSQSALEARLRGRGTESEETLHLRLKNACAELSAWREYDFMIINDQLECASARLIELVRTLRLRTPRRRVSPFGED